MKYICVILLIILTGCDETQYPTANQVCINGYNRCEPSQIMDLVCDNQKRAEFIISCAKAANPMSDEEGEDLVRQCEETSKNLFCIIQPAGNKEG